MVKKNFQIYIVLIFAILVGLIYVAPDVAFRHELGSGFKGMYLTGMLDETYYLSRINAVYKGDYRLGNWGIYEHRNDPIVHPAPLEIIEASTGKLLGLTVGGVDTLFTFVLPICLFLLMFLFISKVSGSFRTSLVGACAILLGYSMLVKGLPILHGELIDMRYFRNLTFMRPISPQFTYVPLFASIIFAWCAIKKEQRAFILSVASGIFLGSLFYISLYFWSYMYAGLAVFTVFCLLKKDKDSIKKIALIYFVSLIVSIPYWLEFIKVASSPNFNDLGLRFALINTRRPTLPLMHIGALLLFVTVRPGNKTQSFWFMLSLLMGGFICLNQHVVTGRVMEPVHWQAYTNKTFLIIAVVLSFAKLGRRLPSFVKIAISIFLIGIFLEHAVLAQVIYYDSRASYYANMQPLSGPIEWLKSNTEKDDVVLANPLDRKLTELLASYTNNYLYFVRASSITSLLSKDEIENRFIASLRLFNYPLTEARHFLREHNGAFQGMSVNNSYGGKDATEQYLSKLVEKYKACLAQPAKKVLKKYKVDYILILAEDKIDIKDRHVSKVYDDGKYKIYKLP